MSGSEHPAYEELLLLESGELDASRIDAVRRHVASCPHCRDRYGRVQSVTAVVAASQETLKDEQGVRTAVGRYARPAIAASTAAALAIYMLTGGTPAARADEVLEQAVARQTDQTHTAAPLRLTGDAGECYVTTRGEMSASVGGESAQFCTSLASAFADSGWSSGDLLSARRFQAWRASLNDKVDTVVESEQTTEVATTTAEGALRLAALEVRASDYLPVAARYEVMLGAVNRAAVLVTEADTLPPAVAEVPTPGVPPAAPREPITVTPKIPPIYPRDELEAKVRLALHAVRADGNLQLAVDRRESGIRVWGVVADEEARTGILQSLAVFGGVTTSVMTEEELYESDGTLAVPWTAYQGDSPPLAHDELDALFRNNPRGRQELLNSLDAATRQLLAATKSRDALRSLALRLRPTPAASALTAAAADFDPVVQDLTQDIAARLESLTGVLSVGENKNLAHAEAIELYELIHKTVFLKVGREDLTLTQALERIAAILD